MAKSDRSLQSTNGRRLLLEKLYTAQKCVPENSKEFRTIQQHINQIVAQNLLEYVNR